MIAFYYYINTPIDFWRRRRLNHTSPIQLLKILLVKLTRTYKKVQFIAHISSIIGTSNQLKILT